MPSCRAISGLGWITNFAHLSGARLYIAGNVKVAFSHLRHYNDILSSFGDRGDNYSFILFG